MIRAYCKVPNAINLEMSRDKRIKLCKDNHVRVCWCIPTAPASCGAASCTR